MRIRIAYLLCVFGCLSAFLSEVQAQVAAPDVRCISVDANGNVTLQWIPPADPLNQFLIYMVGYSTNPTGPFTEVPVTGLATTTYNRTTNADLVRQYYYVKSVSQIGAGAPDTTVSDTFSTILPQFQVQTDSNALITWNPIVSPNLPSSSGTYQIFRQVGAGPWQQIGTAPYGTEVFDDTSFKVCSETLRYRIEIADNSGCTSVSAIIEDLFEDITPPDVPFFDSITVDTATGDLILNWQPSEAGDTDGYIIVFYDFASNQYIIIDTVFGIGNTSYRDTLASGNAGFVQYGVAAFDTCLKGNPPTANTSPIGSEHRSIFTRVFPDYCANENTVVWSHYRGWEDLLGYRLYVSVNGAAYTLLDTIHATDSTYLHTGLDLLDSYCYILQAFDTTEVKSSTSNIGCAVAAGAIQPQFHVLSSITVEANSRVRANLLTDSTLDVSYYSLERSLRASGPFLEVDSTEFRQQTRYVFQDPTARVTETDYFYRVAMYDSCGFVIGYSNTAKTVWLGGEYNRHELFSSMRWTPYLGWDSLGSGVRQYTLYRVTRSGRDQVAIADFSDTSDLRFRDPIEPFITTGSNLCYIVEAREDSGNFLGLREASYSNLLCFSDNPKLWVPNAFRPRGFNPVFKPVLTFGDVTSYQLQILNRNGRIIFETTNVDTGWDGTYNGSDAPLGVYVWRISFTNATGDRHQEFGTVTLLR